MRRSVHRSPLPAQAGSDENRPPPARSPRVCAACVPGQARLSGAPRKQEKDRPLSVTDTFAGEEVTPLPGPARVLA